MPDRYEVVLEANVTKFKSQMKEATVVSENFNKVLQNSRKFIHSEWANGIYGVREVIKSGSEEIGKQNRLYAQQMQILSRIKHLQVNKPAVATSGRLYKNDGYSGSTAIFGSATESAKELSNASEEASVSVAKIGKSAKNSSNEVSKVFSKGVKSVKKLTIGFLGARTAFGLFRKYMSEYTTQNEKFSAKMKVTTSIIANALAPAFEWFANIVQYTIIGIARLIELLTGINILGKAVSGALDNASKSAKKLDDNLSTLDEISNVSKENDGISTGIKNQINALNDFKNKIKEVDEWLEKTGIKKFFKDLQPIIRDVFGWMVDHPLGTLGILGAFTAIKLLLPSLLGVPGGATGLYGVATVLGIIAAVNITEIVNKWKELNDITKMNEKNAKDLIDKWKELNEKSPEFIEGLSGEQAKQEFSKWDGLVENSLKNIGDKLKDLEKYKHFPFRTDPNKKRDKELLDIYVEQLMTYVKWQQESYNQGKLTEEQEEEYAQTLVESRNILDKLVSKGYDYNEELSTMDANLQNLSKLKPEIEISITGNATTKLKDIVNAVNEIKNSKWVKINLSASGGINNFANGGFVGDGEIFRAREAGPELVGTVSGHTAVMNNNQIVESVSAGVYSAVLSAMGGQNDRPIILNVNGRELAQVTYGDYQNEGLRRGTNTALRRY